MTPVGFVPSVRDEECKNRPFEMTRVDGVRM